MRKNRDPFRGHTVVKSKLARGLGITHGAVSQWGSVPAERVLDVEKLTGISRHDLRPDIYGPPIADEQAASHLAGPNSEKAVA